MTFEHRKETTDAGLKVVLVVGAGYGGLSCARSLAKQLPSDYRAVVVNETEFAYHPIGSLRAATVPGWETRVTARLDRVFPEGSRHIVLSGFKVVEISAHSAKLDKASEDFGFDIPFDFAVLATGAAYAFPCRAPETLKLESEIQERLKQLQEEIKEAASILVVGGGPAGVEFTGEVANQYPNKKITLVHPSSRLFAKGWNTKLGDSLANQISQKKITAYYDTRLDTGKLKTGKIAEQEFQVATGETVKADFIFIAHGSRPNSAVFAAFDPSIIESNGAVKVRASLQVEGHDHIFALGDLNNVPENKLAGASYHQGTVAVTNIVRLIGDSKSTLKTWGASRPHCAITFGPNGGAGQLFGFILGAWVVSWLVAKDLGCTQFKKTYGYKDTLPGQGVTAVAGETLK